MKKMICGLVLVFFTTHSFASSTRVDQLQRAVDQFNFNVTVRWDGSDQKEFDEYVQSFKEVAQSLKDQGMSPEEMKSTVLSMIKDPQVRQRIQKNSKDLEKITEITDIARFIQSNEKLFHAQGASYQGSAKAGYMIMGAVAAVFAVVVVIVLVKGSKYVCTKKVEDCSLGKVHHQGSCIAYNAAGTCTSYSGWDTCQTKCVEGYYRD